MIVEPISLFINQENISLISQKLAKIILLLIAGLVSQKIILVFLKKIRFSSQKLKPSSLAQQKRIKTLTNLLRNSTKIVINFIIIIMILSEIGVDITPLLTGAGILGLAVGFGARSLVADLIAGFFIILENQLNVGDEVKIAGHQGRVVKISLRTITLKDKEKNRYIIPNSTIKTITKLAKKQ